VAIADIGGSDALPEIRSGDVSLARRAFEALRRAPGSSVGDLCVAMEVSGGGVSNAVGKAMSRAVEKGLARVEGTRSTGYVYYATGTLPERKPRALDEPRTCAGCGETFFSTKARFCSRECANERRRLPPVPCAQCGNLFHRVHSVTQFCSLTCRNMNRRKVPNARQCDHCGEVFRPGRIEQRLCSQVCNNAARRRAA
jgi:hypothetical protein